MSPIQEECMKTVWHACQQNDSAAGINALVATGRDERQGLAAYNTIKKMADQARDYTHFAGMMRGEDPLSRKLSVQETAALYANPPGNWTGNGGRTWEGSGITSATK